jgi:hypothetical protein
MIDAEYEQGALAYVSSATEAGLPSPICVVAAVQLQDN